MPGGDRTGPSGMGPMTGRRMGYCTGYDHSDYGFQNYGFRNYRGGGAWRGNRRRWFAQPNYPYESLPEEREQSVIENEIGILKNQLSMLEKRLDSLKKEDKNE